MNWSTERDAMFTGMAVDYTDLAANIGRDEAGDTGNLPAGHGSLFDAVVALAKADEHGRDRATRNLAALIASQF